MLLACASAAVLAYRIYRFGAEQTENQMLQTTKALSSVVDGGLARQQALLRTLVAAHEQNPRAPWSDLDTLARAAVAGTSEWVVVGDRSGRQLVNTRRPVGARLPSGQVPAEVWLELDTGRSRVCDLTHGFIEPRIVCVDVPVMEAGRAAYYASVIMRPKEVGALLARQHLQPGSYATVLDRKGVVIWRNVNADRFVGKPGTPDLLKALAARGDGVIESHSLEGVPTVAAYSRSAVSGWTFVVALPRDRVRAGVSRAFAWAAAGALAFMLAGVFMALHAARRISRGLERLSAIPSRHRVADAPARPSSGISEIESAAAALEHALDERALSDERLELAQEVGGIGAWDWDVVRDEGHVSEAYKRMHGLQGCEGPLRFAQVLAVIHPDDVEGYLARIAEARQRNDSSTNDYRVVHADGTVRWIAAKGRPLRDETGTYVRAVGIVRDITADREAEAAIRSAEERYRRLFEQSSDLILTADLDQVIVDCNPAAAQAVGLKREEAIGRRILDFVSPADFEQTTRMLRKKVEGGGTTRYDVRVRSSTGEWLDWEINSGLTYDSHGRPVGLHVVGRDITERKRAELHQRLLINELNHRVKNTLAIVQSLAQQSFKGEKAADVARRSFEARLGALAAAHNLLTRQSWSEASLRETVEAAVEATAGANRQRVTTQGPEVQLPPQTAVSLAMAIHELCTNAIKYGALSNESGQVEIAWSVAESDTGPRLHLRWAERGGPPVVEPAARGFGTRMIERGLSAEMRGEVKLFFDEEGVTCTIEAPIPDVRAL